MLSYQVDGEFVACSYAAASGTESASLADTDAVSDCHCEVQNSSTREHSEATVDTGCGARTDHQVGAPRCNASGFGSGSAGVHMRMCAQTAAGQQKLAMVEACRVFAGANFRRLCRGRLRVAAHIAPAIAGARGVHPPSARIRADYLAGRSPSCALDRRKQRFRM